MWCLVAKNVVEVIFQLVLLVEMLIADEHTCTRGAVVYDVWTCNYVNYVSIIASYCTAATVPQNASYVTDSNPRLTLFACSPMWNVGEDDSSEKARDDSVQH